MLGAMDIRLEVLRINGIWNVTTSGAELLPFAREEAALGAAIAAANRHHSDTGGWASVHLWHGTTETTVFEIGRKEAQDPPA